MKRLVSFIVVISILTLVFTTFVFADTSKDLPQWFKDMITWRKAQVDQAVKDGTITQQEAEIYKSRIDKMEKWHEDNGFAPGMGAGGCGGRFNRNQNANAGFRSGMMGSGYSGYGMMNGFAQ